MRYKAQYKPSDLLDPVSYVWVPLSDCIPKLDKSPYTTFVEVRLNMFEHDIYVVITRYF
jgi:hypothetical protein